MTSIFRSIVHSSIRRSIQTMTDGTITASSDGIVTLGRGTIFKAAIESGDSLTMALVRGWGKGA